MTPGQIASYKAACAELDGMAPEQLRQAETLRAHAVLGTLIQRLPATTPVWRWSIRPGVHGVSDQAVGVEAALGILANGHAARAAVMGAAEQFGLDYSEKPHLNGKNIVAASGLHADVPVKFYDLVPPCTCENCGATR